MALSKRPGESKSRHTLRSAAVWVLLLLSGALAPVIAICDWTINRIRFGSGIPPVYRFLSKIYRDLHMIIELNWPRK